MSKKIIYLLSLLMALSLVFASCKKNGLDPNSIGGGIKNEDNTENANPDTGLYDDYNSIPTDKKPLITYNVFNPNGTTTFRNSVVVPMGQNGNVIAVFSERRYTATTSDNDIALDGKTVTDVVYNLSTKSGKINSWTGEQTVGATAVGQPTKSHGAIVVFKIANDKVVIVSSYGAGISRINQTYDDRTPKSGLQYIVGTLTDNAFTWGTGWQDVKVNSDKPIADAISELNFNDTQSSQKKFLQFGTHSARGVADGNKIYVPIILANQGKTGGATESMGNIILTGNFSNPSSPTWTLETAKKIAFAQSSIKPGWTKQKESRIYSVESSGNTIKYLTVPNGSAGSENQFLFYGTSDDNRAQPVSTGIAAGDGSPGLVKLKWHGSTPYVVKQYPTQNGSPNSMLLMHVRNTERNLHIYLIESTDFTPSTAVKKAFINEYGKSSSIDVLNDGTIITLAEEGLSSGTADQRKFNVLFKRYSQAYLASILQ